MLCAELERMEAQFDDIVAELEDPELSEEDKRPLREAYARLRQAIREHQESGHHGGGCYEE